MRNFIIQCAEVCDRNVVFLCSCAYGERIWSSVRTQLLNAAGIPRKSLFCHFHVSSPVVFHLHPILHTAVFHVFEFFICARKVKHITSAQKFEYFLVRGL